MMGTTSHDIIVKVGLTADQFVWMHSEAEAMGLSDSAFVRQLIQQARRSAAMSSLSSIQCGFVTPVPGHEQS